MRATRALRYGLAFANFPHSSIVDLNPYHILALIETATFEQGPALKSAISHHLRFQAGIEVKVSVSTGSFSKFST